MPKTEKELPTYPVDYGFQVKLKVIVSKSAGPKNVLPAIARFRTIFYGRKANLTGCINEIA